MICDCHVLLCDKCAPEGDYEEPSVGIISSVCEWCGERIGLPEPPKRIGVGKWRCVVADHPTQSGIVPMNRGYRLVPIDVARQETIRRGLKWVRGAD